LFHFLFFAYRLFLFSVLLFLDWRHPTGGLAHAFAGGLAQAFAAPHAFAGGLSQALAACFLPLSFAGGLKPSQSCLK
jgi:hypothetical protein